MSFPYDDDDISPYYSEQCSTCKFGEYKGGCLNKDPLMSDDDFDRALKEPCAFHTPGDPEPPSPPEGELYVEMPLARYTEVLAEYKRLSNGLDRLMSDMCGHLIALSRDTFKVQRLGQQPPSEWGVESRVIQNYLSQLRSLRDSPPPPTPIVKDGTDQ